ncbi:MAG TPA: hypothetical protein VFI14_07075 [Chryseosolibacter sp.]|jgi:hypothetical protein|nr:hypothetical protein [Chryseosolibacter sp.]
MIRFLLIVAIITYILYKAGSFLFKLGEASQQLRNNESANLNRNGDKNKKKPKVTGEYIDYEEVK